MVNSSSVKGNQLMKIELKSTNSVLKIVQNQMSVKMKNMWQLSLAALLLMGCSADEKELTADQIISKAVETHGGRLYNDMEVQFDFRGRHFRAKITEGTYEYERTYEADGRLVKDLIKNDKYQRILGQREIQLKENELSNYKTATNTVIYFALLPFNLDNPVVNRQLMRSVEIKGKQYYKVEITYGKNGGGKDFEDVYVYWVHKENFTIDYLAYSFNINGGGVRFREAYNARTINGIRFQDYINYTIDKDYPAQELDYAFVSDQLREISRIDLDNIQVNLLSAK